MFTVGEFSRLAQVSKRLLHYYDEIDLFSPIHTERFTGYRYYSAEHYVTRNRTHESDFSPPASMQLNCSTMGSMTNRSSSAAGCPGIVQRCSRRSSWPGQHSLLL